VIDRLEIDSQLAEIQARRVILFDQQRSATNPEAEFYEKLRRLDSEERYWRSKLIENDNPAPAGMPQWGKDLWKAVIDLQSDVISWREERRAERLNDAIERDRARRSLYLVLIVVTLTVGADMIARLVLS
jgi:hypothetical protein